MPSSESAAMASPAQPPKRAAAMTEANPATTRSYEIQRFSSGRWMLDSVSDDKDVALSMAKSLMASGRAASGVRVMSVQRNQNGQFSQITIFRRTPGDPVASEMPASKPKAENNVQPIQEKRDFKHGAEPHPAQPKKGRFADLIFALKLAVGIGVTLAAFQALRLTLH
jgi:hypothetical protein